MSADTWASAPILAFSFLLLQAQADGIVGALCIILPLGLHLFRICGSPARADLPDGS